MTPIRIAVIGLGKIARDQHLPAIDADGNFALAATVDPQISGLANVPHFKSLAALFADGPGIDAAILCTPPQLRTDLARQCIARSLHVFLEKPPGMTVGAVHSLKDEAAKAGTTLLAGWHSRFAACVEPARAWLTARRIDRVSVVWRENVRIWHPNQDWIWEPGGLGVFDPGINALSILTHIMPHPFHVIRADLFFPSNRGAPIAAKLAFRNDANTDMTMDLDWRETGAQTWRIDIGTEAGALILHDGGAKISAPFDRPLQHAPEYPCMYNHFTALIRSSTSDVDVRPLELVADAFLCGRRHVIEAF